MAGSGGVPGPGSWAALGRATSRRALLLGGAGTVLLAATPGAAGQRNPVREAPTRVATWATAPTAVKPGQVITVANQTIRQVVHLSVGGDRPCVTLTNTFGTSAVRIATARIALRRGTFDSVATVPGTGRQLTFGGRTEAVLPAGGTLTSDPADLILPPGGDLVISLYLPEPAPIGTVSPQSFQSTLIGDGDMTFATEPFAGSWVGRYLLLSGVTVRASRSAASIAALGDSITVGVRTQLNTNHRWTDLLATRLRLHDPDRDDPGINDVRFTGAETGAETVAGSGAGSGSVPAGRLAQHGQVRKPGLLRQRGVLNLGLSGNRLLVGFEQPTGRSGERAHAGPSAVRRLERDVLEQSGVRYLITLIGVNDLGQTPGTTAEDLIAGHREIISRGRRAGLRVYGGTLLPFGGARSTYDNARNRVERERFNTWMRTSGEYDAVIDFDAAIRDPRDPRRMLAAYDCGDHLHPNDAGMGALAAAVPLALFA
ncbi:GDSL-type esterase/lipase family protein [Actinoplanes sp. NBC_00393]|uniref:GDSL-type esterase/lipase family protein n=1 Tax=Actinoplanes sp. NBC_00393 TaxID=2975953 RepID=UPI002E1E5518